MSVVKELKLNNRIVVREACRVAANHFRLIIIKMISLIHPL